MFFGQTCQQTSLFLKPQDIWRILVYFPCTNNELFIYIDCNQLFMVILGGSENKHPLCGELNPLIICVI